MKKCPYCAEEVQEQAIFCKHCKSSLPASANPPSNVVKSPDANPSVRKDDFVLKFFIGFGILFLVCVILAAAIDVATSKGSKTSIQSQVQAPAPAKSDPLYFDDASTIVPKYTVDSRSLKKRWDGGSQFYILMSKVNLQNSTFKKDVKAIVNDMIKKHGSKITLTIADDKRALDLSYRTYEAMTLEPTKADDDFTALHLIATYMGQNEVFDGPGTKKLEPTTLDFFPGTFTDNKTFGKYIESISPDIQ